MADDNAEETADVNDADGRVVSDAALLGRLDVCVDEDDDDAVPVAAGAGATLVDVYAALFEWLVDGREFDRADVRGYEMDDLYIIVGLAASADAAAASSGVLKLLLLLLLSLLLPPPLALAAEPDDAAG